MKQELINVLFGIDDTTGVSDTVKTDVLTEEVFKWLPDEAFETVKAIKDKAEDEGATWVTLQLQEILKTYISDEDFKKLMLIDEQTDKKGNRWAAKQTRKVLRRCTSKK